MNKLNIKAIYCKYIYIYIFIYIDAWINNPTDCLALIILLNQFTRSVYRNTPLMFSGQNKQRLKCDY